MTDHTVQVNMYKTQLRRLLNKVNHITAAHRHGTDVSQRMLDELCDRQIEVERIIQKEKEN